LRTSLFPSLLAAAATIGALHTAAPDHWVPFVAIARARKWSARRSAAVTLLCGLGHVTVSASLGLAGVFFGVRLLESVGRRTGPLAPFLLVGFGIAYALWGLRHVIPPRIHGHRHVHYDHVHEPSRMTARALFLIFSADPCVAVAPLIFAAAPLGAVRAIAVVLVYEAATLSTMLAFVLPARAGARALPAVWLDRYADAAAGGVIAAVGLLAAGLGW
jgi:hypothetical protein